MNITKRYIHPQEETILNAMEKAREVKGGHIAENASATATIEALAINY